MGLLAVDIEELLQSGILFHPDDLSTGSHHLLHLPVAEVKHLLQHLGFGGFHGTGFGSHRDHSPYLVFGHLDLAEVDAQRLAEQVADSPEHLYRRQQHPSHNRQWPGHGEGDPLRSAPGHGFGQSFAQDQQDCRGGCRCHQDSVAAAVHQADGHRRGQCGCPRVHQVVSQQHGGEELFSPLDQLGNPPGSRLTDAQQVHETGPGQGDEGGFRGRKEGGKDQTDDEEY